MKLSKTTRLLLKIVLVIYGCFIVVWLYNAVRYYGRREVTEKLYQQKLELAEKVYLAKDKVMLPVGRLLDEEVTQALIANGINQVKVRGHGVILGMNLTFFCTLGFQILNFAILLILLTGVLWQPLMKMLDERAEHIRNDLETARNNRTDAEKLLAERGQLLERARTQRQRIMAGGRLAANEQRDKILQQAHQEAERLVNQASTQMQADLERARQELQTEIASLAVQLAEKILKREISRQDHANLIADFIGQLQKRA